MSRLEIDLRVNRSIFQGIMVLNGFPRFDFVFSVFEFVLNARDRGGKCSMGFVFPLFSLLFFFGGCGNDRSVYGGCLIGMLRVSMVCVFFDWSDYLHGA